MIDGVTIVTGNDGKAREYATLLGIPVATATVDLLEVQSLDVAAVAAGKAEDAYAKLGRPVIVDDTGLALPAWHGLPGALVSWFLSTVGPQGLLDMATILTDRRAIATTALGYADADGVRVVTGTLHGTLATQVRGDNGIGDDSIFVPTGTGQTLAQMPRWFERFMAAESSAVSVEEFEAQLVPGLLQTPEYARAVLRAANTSLDDDEIDRRVAVRMERQARLAGDEPLALWVVLDESVLYRHVGGAEVTRAQLHHLTQRAAQPNVTVQVLPYALGAYAAFGHPFTIMTFPAPPGGEVVHMDQLHSGLYLERESDLRRYKLAMNRLRAAALDPEQSRNLIVKAVEDLG
ncbi:Scr1 family TA system antitoxin-like transcriptional regulator [Frankia sp. AgPm24]|uniref:non-canonical purine NTP pyrophosphatase n=1 Tax=Frankia sp. AgPm24 TaxID=631128 RepID=UPI00200DDFE7|nr:non-canonical purine NTP pyrophosphatase [Frankia sp. AgPm24]MCK9923343.1 Scr1 family TA system antitoxin-like transcriptional regulator [Frankia sp. AgPm24]